MVPLRKAKGGRCDQEEIIIYKANIVGIVLFLNQTGRHRSLLYVFMIFWYV